MLLSGRVILRPPWYTKGLAPKIRNLLINAGTGLSALVKREPRTLREKPIGSFNAGNTLTRLSDSHRDQGIPRCASRSQRNGGPRTPLLPTAPSIRSG